VRYPRPPRELARCFLAVLLAVVWPANPLQAQAGSSPPDDEVVLLEPFLVEAEDLWLDSEEAGLGEEELDFGGAFAWILADGLLERGRFSELQSHVLSLGAPDVDEVTAGPGARAPRGFTTPRLRNGFGQAGIPESVAISGGQMITGMLATHFGRSAPGGLVNVTPSRPTNRPRRSVDLRVSSRAEVGLRYSKVGPLLGKRAAHRTLLDLSTRDGPQDFAYQDSAAAVLSVAWKAKETSFGLEIEGAASNANRPGGIPRFRPSLGEKIQGPYVPLKSFNPQGPHAQHQRESASVALLAERTLSDRWTLRAGSQLWGRSVDDHRFIVGQYLLDQGVFSGTREPRREQLQEWTAAQAVQAIFTDPKAEVVHRLVLGAEASHARGSRDQRALSPAARAALPESVRILDPLDPDWQMPPFDPELYSRVLADRRDRTNFVSLYGHDRVTFGGGRHLVSGGLRWDQVRAVIEDRRATAVVPRATSNSGRVSHHLGSATQVWPGKVAAFANYSTAFQPRRAVDVRTGRIQGNETTEGIEAGVRFQHRPAGLSGSASLYRLWNQNITRINPLYNDPVADPNGVQPQLVSSGEERFTGAELQARWDFIENWSLSSRSTWTKAITTRSPDLPQEIGRQLGGIPEFASMVGLNYRRELENGRRFDLGLSAVWVGEHIWVNESRNQAEIMQSPHTLAVLNAGYSWRTGRQAYRWTLTARNLLNEDLAAKTGRAGLEPSVDLGFSKSF
jgi:iron complex outermembrane recepter protein